MSLASLLRPLLAFDGLVAVIVMTNDGLPVEMIGHGLRANVLAAELVTVAESARRCFETLNMGRPKHIRVNLERHEATIFSLDYHYLAIIFEPYGNHTLVSQIVENTRAQLREALGGHL